MANYIDKLKLYFKTKAAYNTANALNLIDPKSIAFVEDTKEVITHNTSFPAGVRVIDITSKDISTAIDGYNVSVNITDDNLSLYYSVEHTGLTESLIFIHNLYGAMFYIPKGKTSAYCVCTDAAGTLKKNLKLEYYYNGRDGLSITILGMPSYRDYYFNYKLRTEIYNFCLEHKEGIANGNIVVYVIFDLSEEASDSVYYAAAWTTNVGAITNVIDEQTEKGINTYFKGIVTYSNPWGTLYPSVFTVDLSEEGPLYYDTTDIDGICLAGKSVQGWHLADNCVITSKLEDKAVTTDKLADGAVTRVKIADNSVNTAKILDKAVTTNKLADESVTVGKLADRCVGTYNILTEAITSVELADNCVTTNKISSKAVTTDKILDKAVTADKLADGSVTAGKLVDRCVGGNNILDETITADKLENAAVTADKLLSNAVTTIKILDKAVTTEKLADKAVTVGKLADRCVGTYNILTEAITSVELADKAVTKDKLADGIIKSYYFTVDNSHVSAGLYEFCNAHKSKILNGDIIVHVTFTDTLPFSEGNIVGFTQGGDAYGMATIYGNEESDRTIWESVFFVYDSEVVFEDNCYYNGDYIKNASITRDKLEEGLVRDYYFDSATLAAQLYNFCKVNTAKIINGSIKVHVIFRRDYPNNVMFGIVDLIDPNDSETFYGMATSVDDNSTYYTRYLFIVSSSGVTLNGPLYIDPECIDGSSIYAENIANGAITTAKIMDKAVTKAKLADDVIIPEKQVFTFTNGDDVYKNFDKVISYYNTNLDAIEAGKIVVYIYVNGLRFLQLGSYDASNEELYFIGYYNYGMYTILAGQGEALLSPLDILDPIKSISLSKEALTTINLETELKGISITGGVYTLVSSTTDIDILMTPNTPIAFIPHNVHLHGFTTFYVIDNKMYLGNIKVSNDRKHVYFYPTDISTLKTKNVIATCKLSKSNTNILGTLNGNPISETMLYNYLSALYPEDSVISAEASYILNILVDGYPLFAVKRDFGVSSESMSKQIYSGSILVNNAITEVLIIFNEANLYEGVTYNG